MHPIAALCACLMAVFSAGVVANPDPSITIGQMHTVHSQVLEEERQVQVYLPNGYASQTVQHYPLFVILDGRMNFKAAASMIHSLAEGGAIPRMVVVGITNTHRWRDLTPSAESSMPGSGGGREFLAFLKNELVPWLESRYRLNGFRVLSGHSLGGLTVLNVLGESPGLFDAYLALSPSLEWGEGRLLNALWTRIPGLGDQMLYLSIADERMERPYYDRLVDALEATAPDSLDWTSVLFEERDDHMSIRITAGLHGLRWVFRHWRLTSAQVYTLTNEQINAFYQRAAVRYKQERPWGLMDMTNAAYWGLYDPTTVDRAMALFRRAVALWPESAYAWSCLGEGLERTGDLEGALEIMTKALAMAKESGHFDLPYFQGMTDRVRIRLAAGDSS